ncbi:MAG: hypothetical protein K0V04_13250 [Deltaproteobacteria bacterium]|nr:hypothetical protein [Deltaproteobacteria bacterium]
MLRSTLASSLLLATALVLPGGCTKKPQLTDVAVPEAGVSLRYDLTPGQQYDGHVRMRNSAQTPMGDVVTVLDFDVALVVSAKSEDGAQLVRATVQGIELDLRLPDGIPAAMTGMNPEAAGSLNGMELRFNLDAHGSVSNEPEAPQNAPPEIKNMISMIGSALTAGFVRVPEQPIKDGESWDASNKEPDENVVSSTNTGTLKGLARNDAGEDLAQLGFVAEIEAKRGEQKFLVKQEVEASFSASGGYPVTVERKINNEIVGQGSLLSEIEATWTKGDKQAVEGATEAAPAADGAEVQEITDPCDPDYVGAGECADDELPVEPAPVQ